MTATTLQQTDVSKKVLIIDDEGDMCLLLNILLSDKGMDVDHVKSLAAAEEYLLQNQPALVLLDNRLPDGFGLDFVSYLKQTYPAIKIIMISGVDAPAKDVALELGADTFLEKPFTKGKLYESIQTLLN